MIKRIAQVAAGSLIGLAVALFILRGNAPGSPAARTVDSPFLLPSPLPAPDVALVAESGDSVRLSELAAGRTLLLFFGYTNCPDVCPITLAAIGRARQLLGTEGEKVLGVMITVDPERDTPEVLAEYLRRFPPGLRGLTGSTETIAQAMAGYGVMAEHGGAEAPHDPSMVTHSGRTFVVREGGVPMTFPSDTSPAKMAEGLGALLKGD